MAITYTGAGGLFTRLKTIFDMLETIETHQGTDLASDADDILSAWSAALADADTYDRVKDVMASVEKDQDSVTLKNKLRDLASAEIMAHIEAHDPTQSRSLVDALNELRRDMIAESETVKENVVTGAATNPATQGPQFVTDNKNADGTTIQQAYPEVITAYADKGRIKFSGKALVTNKLSYAFPGGSGYSGEPTIKTATGGGILTNADFLTVDTVESEWLAGWSVDVGTVGTDLDATAYQTQEFVIAGTPTSGYYVLKFEEDDGDLLQTQPIAYNATASAVQSAIRALPGYENATVATTSGTSPNFTHLITFSQLAGAAPTVTYINEFDTGTITISTPSSNDSTAIRNRAMRLIGGATLTAVRQIITNVSEQQVLGCVVWARKETTGSGVIRIALVDGTNTVINDDDGNANSFTISQSAISSTEFQATGALFRLPSTLPSLVKFEIKVTTAAATTDWYLDEITLGSAQQLYSNGPWVMGAQGVRDANDEEKFLLTYANSYAGRIQTWFGRLFNFQLPSDTSASETISDS